jgi:hypothetical protein
MRCAVVSGAVSAAVLAALLVAPAPADAQLPAADGAAHSPFVREVLTPDGPRQRLRVHDGRVAVTAGAWAYPDHNRREVFHRRGATASRAQTTCATWVHRSAPDVQEGLAVRIRDDRGRIRAVTLTKNVEFGYYWVFNVLTWDTAREGDPWRAVGQFDMSAVVSPSGTRLASLPWRVCLRVAGRDLAFKVWLPGRGTEPTWQDPLAARHTRLPAAFVAAGVPGWYVGHLSDHGRVAYEHLTTRR